MASDSVKKVPMRLSEFSVIDQEFDSIRSRFDAEMKKMEDEMARFRSELMSRESNLMQRSSHTTTSRMSSRSVEQRSFVGDDSTPASSSSEFSSSSTTTSGSGGPGDTHRSELRTWLDGLSSPLIQEGEDDQKCLKLRFDVSQYKPEEIVVKTVDNKLQVHAKHEEKSENRSVYREYNREFLLPKGTNPEAIRSTLSKDGVLTVEAPLPALAGEKLIPISHH